MVRRLKSQVLTELPPKTWQILLLKSGADPLAGLTSDNALAANYEREVKELELGAKIGFTEMSRVRHEQAVAKLDSCLTVLEDTLDSMGEEKLVIFAHHKDVIATLAQALRSYGVVTLTGGNTPKERDDAVRAFQLDDGIRVFIGSLKAAGVGLTLTAASRVDFVEIDFSPEVMKQAADRCHRMGQRNAVHCRLLLAEKSLDAKVAKMLVKKAKMIEKAVG